MKLTRREPTVKIDLMRTGKSPESRLFDVLVALSPVVVWSFVIYGKRAILIELISVVTACALHVGIQYLLIRFRNSKRPLFDLGPAVTGLLLSLTLPIGVPIYVVIIGSASAIMIKEAFGGMGKNPINPALAGRAVLELFFRRSLEVVPVFNTAMEKTAIRSLLDNELPDMEIRDMFLGRMDAGIGEMSALLIIIGGLYLIVRRVSKIETPVVFILAAVAVSMLVAPDNVSYFRFTGAELLGGGLMLSAFFFSADPVTTPHVSVGRMVFAAVCGALTVLCRIYLGYEGVYIIVLVMGLWTPFADRFMRPSVFGGNKKLVVANASPSEAAKIEMPSVRGAGNKDEKDAL